jgi:TatA/E family protein of Tat protein translocase
MFSVPDILVVSVLALLLFGPDRLPKLMRQAGRFMREVQNTSQGFVSEMERAADLADNPVPPVTPYQPYKPAETPMDEPVTHEHEATVESAPLEHTVEHSPQEETVEHAPHQETVAHSPYENEEQGRADGMPSGTLPA